jgi:2,4-dienoyl-CoA reductase-like NADH-dependent reductase (Old Yellow Enzyme family)/thioredoxin reductase
MSYEHLFRPIQLGSIELRNRIAFAPLGIGAYNPDETVNDRYLPFIEARARETALLITQGTRPSALGGVKIIGSYDDRFIPGLKRFAAAAHKNGARFFLQLVVVGGNDPLGGYAPSVLDIPLYKDQWGRGEEQRPKELSLEQIRRLVEDFAQGARRAREAGFDGVEVHGAYGYLISEFMTPATNKRTDEYGGSFENRMRFPVQIIRRIRKVCGEEFPIGFKFNAHMEIQSEGIDEELGVRIAQRIARERVAYLHEVAMGEDVMYMALSKYPSMPTMYQPRNTTVALSEGLKRQIKGVPIMCAGGILKPDEADRILAEGKADLVVVGRALLADPSWSEKARRGARIVPCIKCLVCHNEVVRRGSIARCTVNPYLVREPEEPIQPAAVPKKVMVVGGGPAGITAAVVAARRGHRVSLFERTGIAGGQIVPGSTPEFKYEFPDLLRHFQAELAESQVRVVFNQEVTAETVQREKPDVLIIAVGGEPAVPPIQGADLALCTTAVKLLRSRAAPRGKQVVVVGGGDVGCETALWLRRQGNSVTILEQLAELMATVEMKYHTMILERMLKEEKVSVYTGARVERIMPDSVAFRDAGGRTVTVPADQVVFATGIRPLFRLVEELNRACPVCHVVGDAREPHRIVEAVSEGDRVGRQV